MILSKKILLLNKPKWYIVTRSDEKWRKTVYDLLPKWVFDDGWMPVWRLDLDSKGLLLFTQDWKIWNRLTQPWLCLKTYEIWVRWYVTEEHIFLALKWIDSPVWLLKVKYIEKIWNWGAKTKLKIQINEWKNRHIRRLFGALKDPKFGTVLKVLNLTRVAMGDLKLDIKSWEWRYLTKKEEDELLKI